MKRPPPSRGRGAIGNPRGRFEAWAREAEDEEGGQAPRTTLIPDATRTVIATNRSPDVPFDRSINPYRGCEHGCIYCFARPSHSYLGYSPGLEFETHIVYKPEAAACLRRELAATGYRCEMLALGANTDPYQPAERRLGITRAVLEVLAEHRHPVAVITKSALIERDLDILASMAEEGLAQVHISVTTQDRDLARCMEPRAATPGRRLDTIRALREAGIPVGLLFAPVIPMLNDHELEAVMQSAREVGAGSAGYVLLRLPLELVELFTEWLETHYPERAERVMNRVRETRGGQAYVARFGERMRGTGSYAGLIAQRFRLAHRRLGYTEARVLDTGRFAVPGAGRQLALFD